MVRQDEENLDRFWGWWRVANKEQFFVFFCIGLFTIIVFSLLAYSTVYGKDVGEDLDFIQGEGDILADDRRPVVPDAVLGHRRRLAVRRLPRAARLHRAAVGRRDQDDPRAGEHEVDREQALLLLRLDRDRARHGILLSGFDQPLTLLIIASSLNGVVMFIYSLLLIKLNRQALPEPLRLRGWRLGLMWMISAVFGALSVALLISQI